VRVIAWNIRAGGGVRADSIARQLARWQPDVVALSEFRGTPPSAWLAERLAARGWVHQLATCHPRRLVVNALLVASRWPLRRLPLRGAPVDPCRWLLASVEAPAPLVIGAMHVPNRVTGRKYPFLASVLGCARRWKLGPALLIGDTNSGRRGVDEEVETFNAIEEGWIDGLAGCGWTDAYRHLRGADARAYTWYSPNGRNGFRIDQAFLNAPLLARLKEAAYVWGGAASRGRRDRLSDHAALLVDLADA
jgi:exonuclease III